MKLIECDQGTEAWFSARIGVITASMFKVARQRTGMLTEQQQAFVNAIKLGHDDVKAGEIAGYKTKPRRTEMVQRAIDGLPIGDFSEAAKNYAFRLAVERISGKQLDEGFQTWQMKRGQELEPEARRRHEEEAGVIVQRAGFITTDDGLFGASADGLIGAHKGSEYKCLVSPEGLREVLLHCDLSEFIDQIQGCMWITGRTAWHFGLYCPALESVGADFTWKEVARDDDYINELEADLMEFLNLVNTYHLGLVRRKESASTELVAVELADSLAQKIIQNARSVETIDMSTGEILTTPKAPVAPAITLEEIEF